VHKLQDQFLEHPKGFNDTLYNLLLSLSLTLEGHSLTANLQVNVGWSEAPLILLLHQF